MKKRYFLVIFDVDGTLLNTKEGILSSVKYTAGKFGFPALSDEDIERIFIGPPILLGFQTAYGLEKERAQEAVKVFREHYAAFDLFRAEPYDGIFDLLDFLKGENIEIAVATYKRIDYAEKLLRRFGFYEYTQNVHGADAEGKKSKADIIEECIEMGKSAPRDQILMIGDGVNDEKGAKSAGVDFLGVSYGFGFKAGDEAPFPLKNSPREIIEYLRNL